MKKISTAVAFLITITVAALSGCSREAKQETKEVVRKEPVTVDFQVSLTFQNGDTKPVANTQFYVLSRSLQSVMSEAKKEGDDNDGRPEYGKVASIFAGYSARGYDSDKFRDGLSKVTVAKFQSNMAGTASPESLPEGICWIVGFTDIADTRNLWDEMVTLKAGKNQIYLNQNNAVYSVHWAK